LEISLSPNAILILRIGFLYYFGRELYLTKFKRTKDKFIWFLIVFVFGYYGYAIYLAQRRKLIIKRKFQPKFKQR
jgi:hypothetical protein